MAAFKKSCPRCLEERPIAEFEKRQNCYACHCADVMRSYRKDPSKQAERHRAWREANAEHLRKYRRDTREKFNISNASARAGNASGSFSDHDSIELFYTMAAILTRALKLKFVVDHQIPLRGKTVSGLHVSQNLQIITNSENCKKRISFDPSGFEF